MTTFCNGPSANAVREKVMKALDTNGDGVVDVNEVLEMLGQFGGPGDCDTNGDGYIGVDDLLAQIGNWGPC